MTVTSKDVDVAVVWVNQMFGAARAAVETWEPAPMEADYVPVEGDVDPVYPLVPA